MNQIYTCQDDGHNNELIIGLCLNPACISKPQFCFMMRMMTNNFFIFSLGEYDKAIHCSEKVIELNPYQQIAYLKKGNSLQHLEKYNEAIECYEKLIDSNPNCSLAYQTKVNLLFLF